jgi:hypothetical protein
LLVLFLYLPVWEVTDMGRDEELAFPACPLIAGSCLRLPLDLREKCLLLGPSK